MPDRSQVIAQMVARRRLENVAPNLDQARDVVGVAERHLDSARTLKDVGDMPMAFTAAYDAARKSLAAVLAAHGLRVRGVGGAHRNTGVAAAEFVRDDALGDFEWMRQVRNATEYPDEAKSSATRADVADGIEAATHIVAACAAHLRGLDEDG